MIYSIPLFFAAIYFFFIGAYVLWKKKSSVYIRVSFVAFCFSTAIWQGIWAFLFQTEDAYTAQFLIKIGYFDIIFLPTCMYHFLMELTENKFERKWVYLSYLINTILASFLMFSDTMFVAGYYQYFFGIYPKAGNLHVLHVLQTVIIVSRCLYLLRGKQKEPGVSRGYFQQIRYAFAGLIIYSLAAIDYLCNYGFEFYPPGVFFSIIYLSILSYAITKHHLLDISIVITKTLAWLLSGTIWVSLVGACYGVFHYLGLDSGAVFWMVGGGCLLGVLWVWPRLAIWLQTPLEKKFLRAKVDPLEAMYDFTSELSATATLSGITTLTAKTILNHFELKYVATIQPRGHAIEIQVWGFRDSQIVLLKETVFEYALCKETLPVQISEPPPLNRAPSVLLPSEIAISESLREMLGVGPERVLHLPLREDHTLYLCLGPKLAERKLNATEEKLLEALSVQAMTALQRSLPYEEAVRNYEKQIKLMGAAQTIVTINHQLNSPLTAIKMAFDMLSKMPLDAGASKVVQLGKEAMTRVTEMMKRLRTPGNLKEATYFGDVKMWELGGDSCSENPLPASPLSKGEE